MFVVGVIILGFRLDSRTSSRSSRAIVGVVLCQFSLFCQCPLLLLWCSCFPVFSALQFKTWLNCYS